MRSVLLSWLVALICLAACAEHSDPKVAFDQGEYTTAYRLWLPFAAEGDSNAQNYLGIHHYLGLGVKRDYRQSLQWFKRAASAGHADALRNLGIMYQYGYGVPVDYPIAYKWFYAAHVLGNKRAQQHINDISASKMSNIQIGAAIDEAKAFLSYAIRDKDLIE